MIPGLPDPRALTLLRSADEDELMEALIDDEPVRRPGHVSARQQASAELQRPAR